MSASDCTGRRFVEAAQIMHATEREARQMWRSLVNLVEAAQYDESGAMRRSVTLQQLSDLVDAGPDQLPGLEPGEWELVTTTVSLLNSPEGSGSQACWVM